MERTGRPKYKIVTQSVVAPYAMTIGGGGIPGMDGSTRVARSIFWHGIASADAESA